MKSSEHLKAVKDTLDRLPGQPIPFAWEGSGLTLASGQEVEVVQEENLTTAVVENVILRKSKAPLLVFSPYVSPTFADRFRKNGVLFVDETGNAFLQGAGFYLFVSRDVPKNQLPGYVKENRLKDFSPNALKLIYAFLTDANRGKQARVNQTVRQLQAATGVSTGSVSGIIDSLKDQGFLEEREAGVRELTQREKLFERWVDQYTRKLRPKLVKERYRLPHAAWAETQVNSDAPGLWGGEVAGALLTGYLVPETVTIYAASLPANFLVEHDLRKDPAGRVEVLRPFWPEEQTITVDGCVHPLIVYADLMATEIDRNLETAKRIYEKHLRTLATSD